MRLRSAKVALVAGLVAGGIVLVAESAVVSIIALGATLVLLPAAVLVELVGRERSIGAGHVKAVQVVGLLVCGVLVFADKEGLATTALVVTVALLFITGFMEGHLRAIWWAAVVLISALVADVLWQLGWEPFDRSDEYEPIAQSPFVLIGLPLPMALVAAGVAARWLWRRLNHA
jgi:hypothetical protein